MLFEVWISKTLRVIALQTHLTQKDVKCTQHRKGGILLQIVRALPAARVRCRRFARLEQHQIHHRGRHYGQHGMRQEQRWLEQTVYGVLYKDLSRVLCMGRGPVLEDSLERVWRGKFECRIAGSSF